MTNQLDTILEQSQEHLLAMFKSQTSNTHVFGESLSIIEKILNDNKAGFIEMLRTDDWTVSVTFSIDDEMYRMQVRYINDFEGDTVPENEHALLVFEYGKVNFKVLK